MHPNINIGFQVDTLNCNPLQGNLLHFRFNVEQLRLKLRTFVQLNKGVCKRFLNICICFHFISSLYIYLPDSQESIGGSIHKATVKQLSQLASVDAKILLSGSNFLFCSFFSFLLKIWLKFRTSCQYCPARKSAVKCLFQEHSRMAQVGFKPRLRQSQSRRS